MERERFTGFRQRSKKRAQFPSSVNCIAWHGSGLPVVDLADGVIVIREVPSRDHDLRCLRGRRACASVTAHLRHLSESEREGFCKTKVGPKRCNTNSIYLSNKLKGLSEMRGLAILGSRSIVKEH